MKSFRNTRTFEAALLALLFALAMWAVVPVGYMADVDQDGFKVVLCDSANPGQTLIIGADGQPVEDHEPVDSDGGCIMGRSPGDVPLAVPVLEIAQRPVWYVQADVEQTSTQAPHDIFQANPPPARAPPILI